MKYYLTLGNCISFDQFIIAEYRSPENTKFVADFEKKLIEGVLKYKPFNPTLFEYRSHILGRSLSDEEICEILMIYGKVKSFSGKLSDLNNLNNLNNLKNDNV